MLGDLQSKGYAITNDPEDADAVIINTCAFIDQAKKESVTSIMDAAELSVPLIDYDDQPHKNEPPPTLSTDS